MVVFASALGGIATSITALLKFADNPLVAYFLVLGLVVLDAGIGFAINFQGVIGGVFTFILNNLGVPIVIYSWQVAIFLAILPLLTYALKH